MIQKILNKTVIKIENDLCVAFVYNKFIQIRIIILKNILLLINMIKIKNR